MDTSSRAGALSLLPAMIRLNSAPQLQLMTGGFLTRCHGHPNTEPGSDRPTSIKIQPLFHS